MSHQTRPLDMPLTIIGNQPDCLPEIFRDEANLVIWDRPPDPSWQPFVDAFTAQAGELERFVTLDKGDCAGAALPGWARHLAGADVWEQDLNTLVDMYRCLFEPELVGLRIHVLRGTMCPRFHVDRVPVRLLCTYQGRGTEWLPESAVIRPASGGPLPDQQADPVSIRRLGTGAVGLFKGEGWIGNEGNGLVHRSPAAESLPRLVVGLDWLCS